jgi:hypothetical protein
MNSQPIGYAFAADMHCVACARRANITGVLHRDPSHPYAQPGIDCHGLPLDACDSEGNRIHAVFATDEGAESEYCGDCLSLLIEVTP